MRGCFSLGSMYRNAIGIAKDEKVVVELRRQLCDKSALPGCAQLGTTTDNGKTIAKGAARSNEA